MQLSSPELQAYFSSVALILYIWELLQQHLPISLLKARHKMDNEVNNRTCEVIKDGRYGAFLN